MTTFEKIQNVFNQGLTKRQFAIKVYQIIVSDYGVALPLNQATSKAVRQIFRNQVINLDSWWSTKSGSDELCHALTAWKRQGFPMPSESETITTTSASTSAPVASEPTSAVIPSVPSATTQVNPWQVYAPFIKYNFGVEFECVGLTPIECAEALTSVGIPCNSERYNHTNHEDAWKVVTDASLCDASGRTAEVVSPILKGLNGLMTMIKVANTLTAKGAKVNCSCGTHVHIDGTRMDVAQKRAILATYGLAEGVFDSMMAPSRRGEARWCGSVANCVGAAYMASTERELLSAVRNDRYKKLNLCTAQHGHNTVEFRQHQGTLDGEKIANWVMMCQLLATWCESSMAIRKINSLDEMAWLNGFDSIKAYYLTRIGELAA